MNNANSIIISNNNILSAIQSGGTSFYSSYCLNITIEFNNLNSSLLSGITFNWTNNSIIRNNYFSFQDRNAITTFNSKNNNITSNIFRYLMSIHLGLNTILF